MIYLSNTYGLIALLFSLQLAVVALLVIFVVRTGTRSNGQLRQAIWELTGTVDAYMVRLQSIPDQMDRCLAAQAASGDKGALSADRLSDAAERMCQRMVDAAREVEIRCHDGVIVAGNIDYRTRPQVTSRIEALRELETRVGDDRAYSLAKVSRRVVIEEKVQKQRGGMAVASLALGDAYRSAVQGCLDSHESYAQTRGYGYYLLQQPPPAMTRPPSWYKLPLMVNLLERGIPHLLYVDADALFTNLDKGLEDLFAELDASNACLGFVEDEDGINAGVTLVRNCEQTILLLELIWLYDVNIHQGTWEQYALKYLIDTYPEVRRQVLIFDDPKRLNSFAPERNQFHLTQARNTWTPGDLVCHFSGIRQPHLQSSIERYTTSLSGP